jgi:hypothetical protein
MNPYPGHPDKEVNSALIRLVDALCEWERNTDNQSVLILRQNPGFVFRAINGKPVVDSLLSDQALVDVIKPH